jgi:hypothetical protein
MLAITIHQHQGSALGSSDAALNCGPVADIVGMPHHVGAGVKRYLSAAVNRPIVNYEDFSLSDLQRVDFVEESCEILRLVENRNND